MADPTVPPGFWEDAFKWAYALLAAAAAWLFKDVHQRIADSKAASAAALEQHKLEMAKVIDGIRTDIVHHRDIEAKLFDELAAAERINGQRYNELSAKMSEQHITLNNQIHAAQKDIISHIDRVLSKDRN